MQQTCHACVSHRGQSPKQRCSALYSTYCQCIIQQFTVSGYSLNGTERSMAHGAPLASPPRADCVCICVKGRERERESFATVKCKDSSGDPLGGYSICLMLP